MTVQFASMSIRIAGVSVLAEASERESERTEQEAKHIGRGVAEEARGALWQRLMATFENKNAHPASLAPLYRV